MAWASANDVGLKVAAVSSGAPITTYPSRNTIRALVLISRDWSIHRAISGSKWGQPQGVNTRAPPRAVPRRTFEPLGLRS